MARRRVQNVGTVPPQILWTVVRRDTASFRVYVTDDIRVPLLIDLWTLSMDIKRSGELVLSLTPEQKDTDGEGEFTVFITDTESEMLETDDVFDIQISDDNNVWTIAQGKIVVIEDVTD